MQPIVCQLQEQAAGTKTVLVKTTPGDLPLPWSEKDPYKLPMSIDRVQRLLLSYGGSGGTGAWPAGRGQGGAHTTATKAVHG